MVTIFGMFLLICIYLIMGFASAFIFSGLFNIEFPTENYELHGVIVFWPIIFIIFVIILIIRSFTGLKNIFIHLSHL